MEMRRPISSKSKTCPEGRCVDVARMSREVGAQYPGRSRALPLATVAERRREGVREVSRGHSKRGEAPKARRRSEANSPWCR